MTSSVRVAGKLVSFWPEHIVPAYGSATVKAAWEIADPERISSAVGIVNAYLQAAQEVNNDATLSDHGKTERRRELAKNRLYQLKPLAERVTSLEAQHKRALTDMVQVKPADAAEAIIDIELAKAYREQAPIPTVLERWSERARQALVRLPTELTGMDDALRERIALTLADTTKAASAADDGEALRIARRAVQQAILTLQETAQATAGELVHWFGQGWKLPGVIDALVRLRMEAAKTPAQVAAD